MHLLIKIILINNISYHQKLENNNNNNKKKKKNVLIKILNTLCIESQ
jgi:hypothetical protein